MARQHTIFRNLKSIAGAALIGLGVFILFRNLVEGAARLSNLLGITAMGADTLGLLPTIGLAVSQALQADLFDHEEFLRGFYQILISFWPLLLVIAGSVVSRDSFAGKAKESPKDTGRVDLTAPRSTRK